MTNDAKRGPEEGGFAFRLIFRAVVAVGILILLQWVFDEKTQLMHRIAAAMAALAGAFMFYAVGRPGPLYAAAIGLFCTVLGGFGAVECFLDTSCVPRERALWMIATVIAFVCAVWAFNSYPVRSPLRFLSQAAAILSATGALFLAYYSRAFGGALLFLLIALAAFLAAFSPVGQPEKAGPRADGTTSTKGQLWAPLGGAAAMFWFAYMSREQWTGLLILFFGGLWLAGAAAYAWKQRNGRGPDNAH